MHDHAQNDRSRSSFMLDGTPVEDRLGQFLSQCARRWWNATVVPYAQEHAGADGVYTVSLNNDRAAAEVTIERGRLAQVFRVELDAYNRAVALFTQFGCWQQPTFVEAVNDYLRLFRPYWVDLEVGLAGTHPLTVVRFRHRDRLKVVEWDPPTVVSFADVSNDTQALIYPTCRINHPSLWRLRIFGVVNDHSPIEVTRFLASIEYTERWLYQP